MSSANPVIKKTLKRLFGLLPNMPVSCPKSYASHLPLKNMNYYLTLHNRDQRVISSIKAQNNHLEAVYRKAKFEKLAASPYGFYRGTNHLYWEDFYNDWQFRLFGGLKETLTWVQGDAHVYNFGAFANHGGEVVFGLNDFDDAIVADYQYDLWRMAISVVLACKEYLPILDFKDQRKGLKQFFKGYMQVLCAFEEGDHEREVHFTCETSDEPLCGFLKKVRKKESRAKMLGKWTEIVDGERRFKRDHAKLEPASEAERQAIEKALPAYLQTLEGPLAQASRDHFRIKDVARRLWAGTGSLGDKRFYLLIEGNDESEGDDRILDVKLQTPPPAWASMNEREREEYGQVFRHEGERHARAFRAIAEHPDPYLGWMELPRGIFSVRERSPFKESFPLEKLGQKQDFKDLCKIWGEVLATEHQRAARELNRNHDPYIMEKTVHQLFSGREKQYFALMSEMAFQYTDCVEQDWQVFRQWLESGGRQ